MPVPTAMLRLDLAQWHENVKELQDRIDKVVQSFIAAQTKQFEAISAEVTSQMETIAWQESHFAELGDSISGFVEEKARHLKDLGVETVDEGAKLEANDARSCAAADRMRRLWQQASKTFEFTQAAKERENSAALEEQRRLLEQRALQVDLEHQEQISKRDSEIAALQQRLEVRLSQEVQVLQDKLGMSQRESGGMACKLEEVQAVQQRLDYEWNAEREELIRTRDEAENRLSNLQRSLDEAIERSHTLEIKCVQRGEKLEQMRTMMDEQELEMSQKLERVQQYVKERQATAVVAEKKKQDAEKMAERWQNEVRRCQAEKERLSSIVMEMEGRQTGQTEQWQGAVERHRREVTALEDALRRQESEMKEANSELLSKRDEEYQAKVALEKQREKERSIALLKKKEQEVHVKDQQLRAAKQRIQELESELRVSGDVFVEKQTKENRGDASLPPLLSAR